MIADTSAAWRRNLASMGSPKISSKASWKNTTKMKNTAVEVTEDRTRPSSSDMCRNLLIPAMGSKQRVQALMRLAGSGLLDAEVAIPKIKTLNVAGSCNGNWGHILAFDISFSRAV